MKKSLTSLAALLALGSTSLTIPPLVSPAGAAEVAPADKAESTLAAAQTKLAWNLIEKLAAHDADTTISPASLASALGIVAVGAEPAMKAALAKALGFETREADRDLKALFEIRGKLADAKDVLQIANRIVFAPSSHPNEIVTAGFEKLGIAYSVDDLGKAEAVQKIDAWVKEVTQGAIPEILGGPIEKASFVALNALHFKSKWKVPFDPQLTMAAPFRGVDGKTENVSLMRLTLGRRAFRTEERFVAVDLPFGNERFSLVVITTTDKPASAKDFQKVAGWLSGVGFESRSGDLSLPRFSVSGREDLLPTLDALGLDKARHSPTALAPLAEGAMLSQVIQRATFDVTEEGAEAAAATAVTGVRSLETDTAVHMMVDKPFLYALRDSATGLILISGYVGHAPKGKAA